jgi:hypothetical protein
MENDQSFFQISQNEHPYPLENKKRSEPTLMVDIMVTKLAFQAGDRGSI